MWMVKNKCLATFAQVYSYIYIAPMCNEFRTLYDRHILNILWRFQLFILAFKDRDEL